MKVIFLSGLFAKGTRDDIFENSKGVIQYAADNLQWSLVDGFKENNVNLQIVNLPYIGSYPLRYKSLFIKSKTFAHKIGANDYNVGFVNLMGYKYYSRFINAKNRLKQIISEEIDDIHIVIYAMHTPFLKAAISAKKIRVNIKITLIVPDLPQYTGGTTNYVKDILKSTDNKELYKLIRDVDAFVILSEFMKIPLRIGNRPYVVIEGIYNKNIEIQKVQKEEKFTILYTGTLALRYGIMNLLKAFETITNINYQLWICGDGDGKNEVKEASERDYRIRYFGQLENPEILKLQRRASVLINPRTSESEFTRYSFPSKTIEYLASGTPTIIHPLEGIPKQYYNYTVTAYEQSYIGLKDKILEMASLSQAELDGIGQKGKDFIYENKNPKVQTLKIIKMLKII